MYASVRWLNDYLDPPASADEQAEGLTRAGFPLEDRMTVPVSDGEDERLDFEMTSNRGDCVCHVGLARELAAITGRTLKVPHRAPRAAGPDVTGVARVTNRDHGGCPLYTARVIRGVTVRPSPSWLADRLLARGDIPRNNIVDATNFVLFEMGQPTHVFDLATLRGSEIIIRRAKKNEPFLPIGEGAAEVRLATADLVIADSERAVAIAGVKGGALTAVTNKTTDVLIEAATFDPVTVRTSSRRLQIASDSSYRFERGVPAGQVNDAANRLAQLILELAGGTLCAGVVSDGAPIPEPRRVRMRPDRCRRILGMPVTDEQMIDALSRLSFKPVAQDDTLCCTVPVHRLDIEREIDLIEDVSRMIGHDTIPVVDSIRIRVAPPQPRELAARAVNDALVGMGYVQSITHTLVAEAAAQPFLPAGASPLLVEDDRAGAEPVLRPSLIPSLLRVRAHNQHNGMMHLKLFESAAAFWQDGSNHHEQVKLSLLADMDEPGDGLRPIRGAVARLAEILCGPEATVDVAPADGPQWLDPAASVLVNGEHLGVMGVVAPDVTAQFDVSGRVLAAELDLPRLYDAYPPIAEARSLPSFPDIQRDVSVVLDDHVSWQQVRDEIDGLTLDAIEAVEFVTTFRSRQIGAGRKSLTFRLRFRAPDRTLRHEEVDPQVQAVIQALEGRLGATLRQQEPR